ncbi:MAG TPA: four helix bundle protein [Bacteroidia bacterium]|jgi:four helix bundle protein|nr:four helix bundle protein [Bacteroidia bacterium]
MGKINSFEDLIVWKKSIDLSVEVYKITAKFPREEIFGLTSQIRRASNSVSLNIYEGSARTTKMYINQLIIAKGSATEVLSGSILVLYGRTGTITNKRNHIRSKKMLHSLISSIESKN